MSPSPPLCSHGACGPGGQGSRRWCGGSSHPVSTAMSLSFPLSRATSETLTQEQMMCSNSHARKLTSALSAFVLVGFEKEVTVYI